MESRSESTSAMSVRLLWPKRSSLEARFGKRTLSSLAFPILEFGSSCSLNMLNLADRFGIRRLVRKSSEGGKTAVISTSGFGSGWAFLFRLNVFDENVGKAGTSESVDGLRNACASWEGFFFDRKRFIAKKGSKGSGVVGNQASSHRLVNQLHSFDDPSHS